MFTNLSALSLTFILALQADVLMASSLVDNMLAKDRYEGVIDPVRDEDLPNYEDFFSQNDDEDSDERSKEPVMVGGAYLAMNLILSPPSLEYGEEKSDRPQCWPTPTAGPYECGRLLSNLHPFPCFDDDEEEETPGRSRTGQMGTRG